MNDDQARRLATRIIDTWPTSAKAYVWRDELTPLDYDDAVAAYTLLTREAERPPTPGQLHATYLALRRRDQPGPPQYPPGIRRDEYLRRLAARAAIDPTAAEELARWKRYSTAAMFSETDA